MPRDWPGEYVEIPAYMLPHRPDLPVTTKHRHGVIRAEVQLTQEQLYAFEIEWLNDPEKHPDFMLRALHRALSQENPSEAKRRFDILHKHLSEGGDLPTLWSKNRKKE